MSLHYLLDTVILIDHLNRISAASEWLSKNHLQCAISVITRAETLSGANNSEIPQLVLLLDSFTCLTSDKNDADLAAELRAQYHWKLPDAFQAALAKANGLKLVTRNIKDFPEKKFPFVTIPYHL